LFLERRETAGLVPTHALVGRASLLTTHLAGTPLLLLFLLQQVFELLGTQ